VLHLIVQTARALEGTAGGITSIRIGFQAQRQPGPRLVVFPFQAQRHSFPEHRVLVERPLFKPPPQRLERRQCDVAASAFQLTNAREQHGARRQRMLRPVVGHIAELLFRLHILLAAAQALAFGRENLRQVIATPVLGVDGKIAVSGGNDALPVARLLPAFHGRDGGLFHRRIRFQGRHGIVEDHRGLAPALQSDKRLRQPQFERGVVAFDLCELLQLAFDARDDSIGLKHERLALRALFAQQVAALFRGVELRLLMLQQSLARPEAIQTGDGVVVFLLLQTARAE
jgi:hypothetical protein